MWTRARYSARDRFAQPLVLAGDHRHQQPTQPGDQFTRRRGVAAAVCHRAGLLRWHAGIFDRAHHRALRRVEMSDAFGAFLRVDDVHVILETNGGVGTFEFASAAYRALRGDYFVGHLRLQKRASMPDMASLSSGVPELR